MFSAFRPPESGGSTTSSWPQQVFGLEELPESYQPYIQDWMDKGMPVTNATFIPYLNSKTQERGEYVITWHEDRIMLLSPTPFGGIKQTVICNQDILYMDYHTFLLDCCITLYYLEMGRRTQVQFHYNSVMERVFIPILNIALHQPVDYEKKILQHENPFCEALKEKSPLMFNYGKLAYRLDPVMFYYFWECQPIKRTSDKNEYFVSLMPSGSVIIDSCDHDSVNASYLPWREIRNVQLIIDRFYRIQCEVHPGRIFTIPVRKPKLQRAREFVSLWQQELTIRK